MTNEEFFTLADAVTTKRYTYAKTMPKHTHYYSLRWDWENDTDFVEAVTLLRQYGYERRFYSKSYTSFDVNDYYYWTMGEPIDKDGKPWTYVLNRAKRAPHSEYDLIASMYDGLFSDKASIEEDKRLMELLSHEKGKSVLDIGCGTGLFLQYNYCPDYTGIDPSVKMLQRLRLKFPDSHVVCTDFERFYMPRKYDEIVSLYGAASYLTPQAVSRIPHFLSGKATLMFYKDGYRPVTYDKTGVTLSHHSFSEYEEVLKDYEVGEFGNYMVARVEVHDE